MIKKMENLKEKIKYTAAIKTLDRKNADEYADIKDKGLESMSNKEIYEYMLAYENEDRRDNKNNNTYFI